MVTGKQVYAITSLLAALVSAGAPALAGSAARAASAAIQATAHVEAPLGLTEQSACEAAFEPHPEPGEHLFWLYYPRRGGVRLQIETSGGVPGSADRTVSARNVEPNILLEYPQAALVDLAEYTRAPESATTSVTVTVVFTDN